MRRLMLAALSAASVLASDCLLGAATLAQQPTPRGTSRLAPAPAPNQSSPIQNVPRTPANSTQTPPDSDSQAQLDQILQRWSDVSQGFSILDVQFTKIEINQTLNIKTKYQGRAILKRPNRALLTYEREDPETEKYVPDSRTQMTGTEVVQWEPETKQIHFYPLPEDAQLRALEEGPLQFLFNMNVNQFKWRYSASLDGITQTEQGTYYKILLFPRHAVDRETFVAARLFLDTKTLFPAVIDTLDPNERDRVYYRVTRTTPRNPNEVGDEFFEWTQKLATFANQNGWELVRHPSPSTTGLNNSGAQTGQAPETLTSQPTQGRLGSERNQRQAP